MMVEVADLRDAKALSTRTWDGLLPSERRRALTLLGTMYRYHDELATYTMFANGRIVRLREVLQMALDGRSGWQGEARAALKAGAPSHPTVGGKP